MDEDSVHLVQTMAGTVSQVVPATAAASAIIMPVQMPQKLWPQVPRMTGPPVALRARPQSHWNVIGVGVEEPLDESLKECKVR